MKRTVSFLFLLTSYSLVFTSCKKNNKQDINTDEVRLQAIEIKQSNGDINKLIFDYDANGRITKISSGINNETPTPSFIITYSGNEVLIPYPVVGDVDSTIKDTAWLLLNAEQQVTKRIFHSFKEFKAPAHKPQRSYSYDTTTYNYDEAGFLKQQIQGYLDTTWYNPGIETTTVSRTEGLTDFTIKNGNVVSSKKVVTTSGFTRQGAIERASISSTKTNHSFEYARAYPNRIDFKNAAILNELQLFFPLLNKSLHNMPERISVADTTKDKDGIVTSSNSFTINQRFYINVNGFIFARFDPATPTLKTTYIYNK